MQVSFLFSVLFLKGQIDSNVQHSTRALKIIIAYVELVDRGDICVFVDAIDQQSLTRTFFNLQMMNYMVMKEMTLYGDY